MSRGLLRVAALILLSLAWRSAPCEAHGHGGQPPPPQGIDAPPGGIDLPMEDFGGRPVVNVRIGAKGPFRFVVDTGATVTVIGAALKEELSLATAPGMAADPGGGGPAPAILSIPELRLADMVLRGVIAAVLPGSPLATGENAPRGVLSASSFPGYLVTFDYPGRRISIRKGELDKADDRSIFGYAAEDFLPTVPIRVAGREMRAHLDTGSAHGLTLPARLLKEIPLSSEPKEAGTGRTHGGEFPITQAGVKGSIAIGALDLEVPFVSFADVRSGADPAIANIGFQVLRDFVVTLDSKNHRVRIARP